VLRFDLDVRGLGVADRHALGPGALVVVGGRAEARAEVPLLRVGLVVVPGAF
jgi:hypothetical protein